MRHAMVIVFVALTLVAVGLAGAAAGDGYDLPWFSVDGGGGVSSGGVYTANGTIGQPDTGTLSGGDYHLQGGFWPDSVQREQENDRLYLPIVRR